MRNTPYVGLVPDLNLTTPEVQSLRHQAYVYLEIMGLKADVDPSDSMDNQVFISTFPDFDPTYPDAPDRIALIRLSTDIDRDHVSPPYDPGSGWNIYSPRLTDRMKDLTRSLIRQIRECPIIAAAASDEFRENALKSWYRVHDDHIYTGENDEIDKVIAVTWWSSNAELIIDAHQAYQATLTADPETPGM